MTLSRGPWEAFLLAFVPLALFPALAYGLLAGGAPPLAALVAAASLAAALGVALASFDPALRESRNRAWLANVKPEAPEPPSQLGHRVARIALETLGVAALALAAVAGVLHALRLQASLPEVAWPPLQPLLDPALLAPDALPWLAGSAAAVAVASFALRPFVERSRRRRVAEWAARQGWTYAPGPDEGVAHRQPRNHPFDFGTRGKRAARGGVAGAFAGERWLPSRRLARDIVSGALPAGDPSPSRPAAVAPAGSDADFLCFEYEYRVEVERPGALVRRRRGRPHRYCVLETRMPAAAPADLAVVKERLGLKVAGATGSQDINFESDAFSRQFWVDCADRRFAYDVLHPRTLELLLDAGPDVGWHWNGTVLTAWIAGRFDPARCAILADCARRFRGLVPRHVLLDAGVRSKALADEEARREAEGLPPTWALPEAVATGGLGGGLLRWMQDRQERALRQAETEMREGEGKAIDGASSASARDAQSKQAADALQAQRPLRPGGSG